MAGRQLLFQVEKKPYCASYSLASALAFMGETGCAHTIAGNAEQTMRVLWLHMHMGRYAPLGEKSGFLPCESYWLALALNDSSRKISRNRVKASQ
jgi:hypothetical protein